MLTVKPSATWKDGWPSPRWLRFILSHVSCFTRSRKTIELKSCLGRTRTETDSSTKTLSNRISSVSPFCTSNWDLLILHRKFRIIWLVSRKYGEKLSITAYRPLFYDQKRHASILFERQQGCSLILHLQEARQIVNYLRMVSSASTPRGNLFSHVEHKRSIKLQTASLLD